MPHLMLTFLGQFHSTLDGRPLTAFESNKVRALLAYLAVEAHQPHSRSALANLLWPGYSDESARTTLRRALYQVRQLLGDANATLPWLLVSRQTIQFNPVVPYTLDVNQFVTLLVQCASHSHHQIEHCDPCLERLRQAVELYQGDFLAGFAVNDSDHFEEWRRIKQEELHLQALIALQQLTTAFEARGDDEQTHAYALRLLALEPWHEEAHRQIMRSLARSGQRNAALAQYNACRKVLLAEFGIEPDHATQALYVQIQSGAFVAAALQQNVLASVTPPPSIASPLSTIPPQPIVGSNLPVQLTPFIGREAYLRDIIQRLQDPSVRLLTLVGAGGMGKTRLVLEAVRMIAEQDWPRVEDEAGVGATPDVDPIRPLFPDGIFFVGLAGLTSAIALAPTIATALTLPLSGADPENLLLNFLRPRHLLLILDNFEHLLDGVDLIIKILQTAPDVQLVTTTREQLSVQGEQIYTVREMNFPLQGTLAEAAQASAVRLFIQQAQRVRADFQLNEDNVAAVLRICQLVQGMPLGLELAAAWVEVLSLPEIATEIEKNVDFLTVDWRNVPDRQRSMRAIFAWSWQLLTVAEQQVFGKLALFCGGFTREAAEQVAGASLRILAGLVQKSLIRRVESSTPPDVRYEMHELLRQFAAEQLAALPVERVATEQRYSMHFLKFVAERTSRLQRNEPRQAANEIRSEIDNIRQAWRLAAQQQLLTMLEQSVTGLREFYVFAGLTSEGADTFELAISALRQSLAPGAGPIEQPYQTRCQRLLGKLLGFLGLFRITMGQHAAAQSNAEEALRIALVYGGSEGEALGSLAMGQALRRLGQSQEAQDCLERTVEIAQRERDTEVYHDVLADAERRAYGWLCSIALTHDDYQAAQRCAHLGLQVCRNTGRLTGEIVSLTDVFDIARTLGDYTSAYQASEQALLLARQLGFQWGEATALWNMGDILRLRGGYALAASLLEQAVTLFRAIGQSLTEIWVIQDLGRLHIFLGQYAQAQACFERSEQLLQLLHFPARETYLGVLPNALLAHFMGNQQQALRYAERGWQMAHELYGYADQADALVVLGFVQEQLHALAAASDAYQQAFERYGRLELQHKAAEPLAGLARLALQQGDMAAAQRYVDRILPLLREHVQVGLDEPFLIYLTCYRVLTANNDPQAISSLQMGYDLLQSYMSKLEDPSTQQSFAQDVPIHRQLIQTYRQQRAQDSLFDGRTSSLQDTGPFHRLLVHGANAPHRPI